MHAVKCEEMTKEKAKIYSDLILVTFYYQQILALTAFFKSS